MNRNSKSPQVERPAWTKRLAGALEFIEHKEVNKAATKGGSVVGNTP